jgi:hypothetical protein
MAIGDPRKFRPVGQRPDQASFDAEEDPLVELARIVSEDGGFSERRGERSEKVRPIREEPDHRSALSAELEAELLQELESSFAARQASTPPQRQKPAPASVQPIPKPQVAQQPAAIPMPVGRRPNVPPPAETQSAGPAALDDTEAEDLLRSIEHQLGQFERRAQAIHTAPASDGADQIASVFDARQTRPEQSEHGQPKRSDGAPSARQQAAAGPSPSEYRFRGPAGDYKVSHGDDPVVRPEHKSVQAAPTAQAEREVRREQAANGASSSLKSPDASDPAETFVTRGRSEIRSSLREMRPSLGEVQHHTRENETRAATARTEAEAVEAGLANVEAEISRGFEPRYADPSFGPRRQQIVAEEVDEPRVASVAAAREQIERAPSRNPGRKQRRGSRKALLTTASVILVAAIGAAAAMYLRTTEQAPSGPPPVIASPEGAAKVEAPQEQTADGGDTVGEAVYNRVAGNAPETEEQVVDSAEEPREIARIVLPSQAENEDAMVRNVGEDAAADADAPAAAEAGGAVEEEIGPRRVQTFAVRPDGTIVRTDETAATSDPASEQQQQLAAQTEQIEPVPVATVAIGDPSQAAEVPAPALRPTEEVSVGQAAAEQSAAPPPAIAAAEPAESAPTASADVPPAAPIEQAALSAEPATLPAPSTGGGYVVQVSSQRTPEQAEASFADLQSRYPSVLGGLTASVQEADLGAKGIYYRVRVGPWASRDEAIGVCEALKGAGGTCFVTE